MRAHKGGSFNVLITGWSGLQCLADLAASDRGCVSHPTSCVRTLLQHTRCGETYSIAVQRAIRGHLYGAVCIICCSIAAADLSRDSRLIGLGQRALRSRSGSYRNSRRSHRCAPGMTLSLPSLRIDTDATWDCTHDPEVGRFTLQTVVLCNGEIAHTSSQSLLYLQLRAQALNFACAVAENV